MADRTEHQRALEQFKLVVETEQEQRARELEDLKFDAGQQWPEDVVALRSGFPGNQGAPAVPARPMITIRTLDQPTAQIINQARNARFAIKISPKSEASQDEADVRQGLIRAIEYASHAQTAYLWAYMRAVICGRGYFRINKRYAWDDPGDDPKDVTKWDQEACIDLILNGASVYLDPWAQAVNDPGAAEWGFITEDVPEKRYIREYGKSKLATASEQELTIGLGDQKDQWIKTNEQGEKSYRIAERFWTVYDTRQEQNPTDPEQTREVTTRKVMWAKLNGLEFIEGPQEWDGKYIPIIPVIGNEKNIGGKRYWEGLVRPNIGPCRMINYLVSSDAENMGLATKAPWIGYAGQFEGFEEQWRAANTRNQPYLEVNATTDATGAQVLPHPDRNVPAYPPSTEAIGLYVNFVRSTTGVPDAALGHVNANDKSGKAIAALQQASEQGTSNFPDNLQRAIQHAGCVLLDLLPKLYDRPGRIVQILTGQTDEQSSVMLNQPFIRAQGQPQPVQMTPQGPQPPPGVPMPAPPPAVEHFDLSKGQYSVVVEVGKSFATQQGEERDALLTLGQIAPELLPRFIDLLVKSIGGPQADLIAERLKPPGTDDDSIPPQIKQAVQAMQQELQKAQQIIAMKQVETSAKLEEASMDNQTRIKVAEIGANATIAVAELKAQNDDLTRRLKAVELFLSAEQEARLDRVSREHDHSLQGHQQAHDAGMQAQEHAHALAQAQQAHEQALAQGAQGQQHALEQGDQAHGQALEQGQQAADLASQQESAQNSASTA